uniref:Lipocalin n=1 Tax=Anisakis simplex TaxID=6269 RepID=A0A0M3J3Z1_ANISI
LDTRIAMAYVPRTPIVSFSRLSFVLLTHDHVYFRIIKQKFRAIMHSWKNILVVVGCLLAVTLAKEGKKCGLPPFVVEMPDEEQKEVKTIWRNYKKGDDCGELREQTKAVVSSIPVLFHQ